MAAGAGGAVVGVAALAGAWGRGMASGSRPGGATGLAPGGALWLLAAAVMLHSAERGVWAPAWLSGAVDRADDSAVEVAAAAGRAALVGGVWGAVGIAALGSGPRGGFSGACAAGLVLAGALNHARLLAANGFTYHPGSGTAIALLLPLATWALARNASRWGSAVLGLAFGFLGHGVLAFLASSRARGDLCSCGFALRLAGIALSPAALGALAGGGDMLLGLARSKPAPTEPSEAEPVPAAEPEGEAAAETKKDA